jgi:hypothetical protein
MTSVIYLKAANEIEVKAKKAYMGVNVILTFETLDEYEERQEFFDLKIPISKKEINAVDFIHKKLFKRIVTKCKRLNRRVEDLIKISTASNWKLFTETTQHQSLTDIGHYGKWFFGKGRSDLDSWEKELIEIYGFGVDADLSYLNDYLQENT